MNCQILLKTKRHTFGKEITDCLKQFAILNRDDDRKTFKAKWEKWIENIEINNLIACEKNKQVNADVLDKMYKSTWFYYRNKLNEEIVEKPERKKYDAFDGTVIRQIEKHIEHQIQSHLIIDNVTNIAIGNITPAESFDAFCKDHRQLLLDEINDNFENANQITDEDAKAVIEKFKKAYKNKFYTIRVKLMQNK
jgi:hypothetical protein